MFSLLVLGLVLQATVIVQGQNFKIPEATLEFLSPKGLRISVPDWDKDVTLVAFHVNINEPFYGVEAGRWAVDIHKKRDGHWSLTIPELVAKRGDTVNYWVYAIRHGVGYQNLDRSYQLENSNPHTYEELTSLSTCGSTPPSLGVLEVSPLVPTRGTTPPPSPVGGLVDWRGPCTKSDTTVLLTEGAHFPCSASLVFDASFRSDTDLAAWSHRIHIGASNSEDAFTVFTSDKNISRVDNNVLLIKPDLLEHKYSANFVRDGNLTLDNCTATQRQLCSAEGVLPPVLSARLTTSDRFSFRYGLVEIRAKLPQGDYIVPELWLEPKDSSKANSRVVLGSQRVREDDVLLEAGLDTTLFHVTQPRSWMENFHVFKLIWTADGLEFHIDNNLLGKISTTDGEKFTAFNNEFYITLGVHVEGLKDIPNSTDNDEETKPWKNSDLKARLTFWRAQNRWHSSWSEDSALRVDYVKVTAL